MGLCPHCRRRVVSDRRDVRLRMSCSGEREARSIALEKAYVHEVYDQISAESRAGQHRGTAWPKVTQFLAELEPGSLVCDVGCGNGKYLNVNSSVFKIGADRCHTLVNTARKKHHEVLLCDNLSLPFRDDSFDAVLSVAVVHHFATTERRVGAIRELARVLRIGGRLVITVWAMEQRHRKQFESQDVLVPWHRQQHLGASLDFTSATTTTSEEETTGPCLHERCTGRGSTRDSLPSTRLCITQKKRGRSRHKSRYNDPYQESSPGSSSLSSPNETCYSFVRRALQKLAGSTKSRARVRPWFMESWSSCAKEEPPQRHDPEGCEGAEDDLEDIQDLPIELRRLEEDHKEAAETREAAGAAGAAERGQARAARQDSALGHKSKSLTDILSTGQRSIVRSRSSVPSLNSSLAACVATPGHPAATIAPPHGSKPKLVKQKKSICEEDMDEEGRDEPTDMRDLVKALPEFRVAGAPRRCGGVFKQSSMNEELMSTERLREKERVRQNIQKQASLNEELIFRRNRTLDSLKDTFFSTSTAKRFQLLKNGFTNKLKSSTTGIEKVAGTSFKNGFVRILQGWKGGEMSPQLETSPGEPGSSPTAPESKRTSSTSSNSGDDKKESARRHSREDGSDSSKDSSLQSDTSVDSEDSFASVIFVPKQDSQQGEPSGAAESGSPVPTTSPKSPQFPTSPKSSQQPPASPKTTNTPPVSPKTTQATTYTSTKTLVSPNTKTTPLISPNTNPTVSTSHIDKSSSLISPNAMSASLTSPNTKSSSQNSQNALSASLTSPNAKSSSQNSQNAFSASLTSPNAKSSSQNSRNALSASLTSPKAKSSSQNSQNAWSACLTSPNAKSSSQNSQNAFSASLTSPNAKSSSQNSQNALSASLTSPNAKSSSQNSQNAFSASLTSPKAKSSSLTSPKANFTSLTSPNTNPTRLTSPADKSIPSTSPNIIPTPPSSPEAHQDRLQSPHPHLTKQKSMTVTSPSLGSPVSPLPLPSEQEAVEESVERKTSPHQHGKGNHIQDLLCVKPAPVISRVAAAGVSSRSSFPLVRRSSAAVQGRADRPLPRLLSLELFNPETDDMDSDSSGVSSPDSISSVISVLADSHLHEDRPQLVVDEVAEADLVSAECEEEPKVSPSSLSLLEAAADVASSLEETVDAVIQSSPRARRRQLQLLESSNPLAIIQDGWSSSSSGRRSLRDDEEGWDEGCRQHLAEFAEKLSEKLLEEIDQYRQQTSQPHEPTDRLRGFHHMNDPYLERLSEELNDLTRLSEELQERKSYIASLNNSRETIPSVDKPRQEPPATTTTTTTTTFPSADCALLEGKASTAREFCHKQTGADDLGRCPGEETPPPRSAALKAECSLESSDAGDASEMTASDAKTPSTASLGPESSGSDCSKDLRFADRRTARCDGRSSSEEAPTGVEEREDEHQVLDAAESRASLSGSTSQESLPSDSGGGAITFHRYYHVFREGELDQLIERYADNLHIISSYYDHANWCVVAEKVHVWTI